MYPCPNADNNPYCQLPDSISITCLELDCRVVDKRALYKLVHSQAPGGRLIDYFK